MFRQAGTNLAGDHAYLRQVLQDQALALSGAKIPRLAGWTRSVHGLGCSVHLYNSRTHKGTSTPAFREKARMAASALHAVDWREPCAFAQVGFGGAQPFWTATFLALALSCRTFTLIRLRFVRGARSGRQ